MFAPTTAGIYTVVATFSGSADYALASGQTIFTISDATPTVSVADVGGVYNGSGFRAMATVTGLNQDPASSLENTAPTLSYYAGTTATGAGSATAPATVGTYTVVASFAGSTDYAAASNQTTFTITKATPLVMATDAGGIFSGSAFAAAGTVTGVSGIPAASLENVTPTLTYYTWNTAGGTASAAVPTTAGTYSVTAAFAGSTDYAAATSQTTYFTIAKATPTITINDPTSPSVLGQQVVLTATIGTSDFGFGSNLGTLTFYDHTTPIGSGTISVVNGVAQATYSTNSLPLGTHAFTASYAGSANINAVTSAYDPHVVTVYASSTTVSASPKSSSVFGQPVTFSVTVSAKTGHGTTPTGNVIFEVGGKPLPGNSTVTLRGGKASFSTAGLPVGNSQTITAVYQGDKKL